MSNEHEVLEPEALLTDENPPMPEAKALALPGMTPEHKTINDILIDRVIDALTFSGREVVGYSIREAYGIVSEQITVESGPIKVDINFQFTKNKSSVY